MTKIEEEYFDILFKKIVELVRAGASAEYIETTIQISLANKDRIINLHQ